jgi:hypothetical protein
MKALPGKVNSPALALLLLAPVLGELVSGHMSPLEFLDPGRFLLLALPYGLGALVCRELKVRWGKGWLAFLLLAVAYGLYEEGVVALVMVGLVLAAWRLAPCAAASTHRRVPRPLWFASLGAANMTAVFSGTYMIPEMSSRPPMVVVLCLLALVDLVTLWLLLRWSDFGRAWVDRRRFALVVGWLACFIAFGFLADADEGFTGKSITSLLSLCALGIAAWRLRARRRAESAVAQTADAAVETA